MRKSIIYFMVLIMLVSVSCSTPVEEHSTSTEVLALTPEPLKLINGKIDACLLVGSAEVETVLGMKVTSKIIFPTGMTGCKYVSATDSKVVLTISLATDTTLKEDKYLTSIGGSSAIEQYEMIKLEELNFQKNMPSMKVEDIDNIGDQAYFQELTFLVINVLKNNVYYQFHTRTVDDGGIGYDELMKLVKIALQRMP